MKRSEKEKISRRRNRRRKIKYNKRAIFRKGKRKNYE